MCLLKIKKTKTKHQNVASWSCPYSSDNSIALRKAKIVYQNSSDNPIALKKAKIVYQYSIYNPIALRKAKTVYNFGLSECNRVK